MPRYTFHWSLGLTVVTGVFLVVLFGPGWERPDLAGMLYVPVLLTGVRFGPWPGLAAGLVVGGLSLVLPAPTAGWPGLGVLLVRPAAFAAAGWLIGAVVRRYDRQQEDLQRLLLETVQAHVNAVEATDPYTAGHSRRVSALSEAIGRELKLKERDLTLLRIGALLHDIGKVGVPLEILRKPGPLTPREYEIVQMHTVQGDRILAAYSTPGISQIRDIVRHHHERLDGSGYPDGLCGATISLSVRIVAVADAFDAMNSHRSHRRALGREIALAELAREVESGHLDARVVRALQAVLRQWDAVGADLSTVA